MFPRAAVLQACLDTIAEIDAERKLRRQKLLDKHRTYFKYLVFGQKITRTDAECTFWCDQFELWAVDMYAWGDYDRAAATLAVVRATPFSRVWMDAADFSAISNHYQEAA
jgi:hypothetical protein